jgi:hypothetical protein
VNEPKIICCNCGFEVAVRNILLLLTFITVIMRGTNNASFSFKCGVYRIWVTNGLICTAVTTAST